MSDAARLIDGVIKARFAPALRELGFKKKGRTFRRRVTEATQVVNVQASQSNVGSDASFTVNLGIYFPAAARFCCRYEELAEPAEIDCPLRERIGLVMPAALDLWWNVTASSDADTLSQTVTDIFRTHGLPWLVRFAVLEAAATNEHRRCSPIDQAVLLVAASKRQDAIDRMTQSLAKSDLAADGWLAFAVAAGLENEYRAARRR